MSLQDTNLVDAPTWVGLDNFRAVIERPAAPDRGQEHGVLRAARAALRLSDPARRGRADERAAARRAGFYSALAYLPVVHPAGRRGAALEDVLRRRAPPACSTPCSAGSASAPTPGCSRRRRRCRRSCSRRPGRTPAATIIIYLAALTQRERPSSTRPRRSTARRSGGRSGTSRCRSCAACCS